MPTAHTEQADQSSVPFHRVKSQQVTRASFLAQFSCLGSSCEDTCCKGWDMQLDDATYQRYAAMAPELLGAVDDGATGRIMRREATTGACVKLEGGLCGVQAKHGTDLLGDACHFYPRITRALGDTALMTATLSCPEAARLMLLGDEALSYDTGVPFDRMPTTLKNYLPETLAEEEAITVHQTFLLAAGDATAAPERIMARLISVTQSLAHLPQGTWPEAVGFYLRQADNRLPTAEASPVDPFNLLHMVCGLTVAAQKNSHQRLMQTLGEIERALGATLDWQSVQIHIGENSEASAATLAAQWQTNLGTHFAPLLRRWIQAQLSMALFPYAGFGRTLQERTLLLAVRFALVKLALMAACAEQKQLIDDATAIRVVQSLSRLLDHLAEPELMLTICDSAGWTREPRLRGLIGDC